MEEDNFKREAETKIDRRQICRVVYAYQSSCPDPLVVSAGEQLMIGAKETSWSGWVWCTDRHGKSSWVPEKYIERGGNTGTAICHYDATELSVNVEEELIMGEEESGWIWCMNREGQWGWVPADCIEKLQEIRGSEA